VYLAPSAYEAGFISSTHDELTLSKTLKAATFAFSELND
jgi:glutamate-1-semialdehyde 2,1-aminomutase